VCSHTSRYRDCADIVAEQKRKRRIEGTLRNILNWMNDVFRRRHTWKENSKESRADYSTVSRRFFEKQGASEVVPSLKTMVEQLSAWKMFGPMTDSVSEIYDRLYSSLCLDTHLIPDKTMMGRLMVAGKDPSTVFEPSQEEFGRFLDLLCRVAEIGALAVLNVLEDDARTDGPSGRKSRRCSR